MTIDQRLQGRIKAMAEELRREMHGPRGAPRWGTKFTEIENTACDIADALARELMSQQLQEQEQEETGGPVECAVCGRHAGEDDLQPRLVTTRRGDVSWRERRYYCKHCRRAFFPSGEGLGIGR
jgi:hypothetical protein